jgi:hypothetical protein
VSPDEETEPTSHTKPLSSFGWVERRKGLYILFQWKTQYYIYPDDTWFSRVSWVFTWLWWRFKVVFSSLLSRLSNKRVGYGGTFKAHTHTSRMRIIRWNSQRNSKRIAAGILRWLDLGLISGVHFCLYAKHDRQRSCSPINRGTQIHNTVIMTQVSVSWMKANSFWVLSVSAVMFPRGSAGGAKSGQ